MELRLIIAYVLIVLMIVAAAAWIAHARYNTRDRKASRQRTRDAERLGRR